jgi:allantoate deiminase
VTETAIETGTVAGRFLAEIAEVGRDGGGWSRTGFSPVEREAHAVFGRWMRELGLEVTTDAIGNTIAELPGTELAGAVVTGSHLDSVPCGGTFDGAAGVAAGVEAVSRLLETGARSRRPIRVVAFSCEEGASFGAPCIGSRCVTGEFGPADLRAFTDEEGISAWERARDSGLDPDRVGDAVWRDGDVAAFLELHIEQGRVLEERGAPLGVVHSIAGSTRVQLRFSGRADHSGATPMWLRADALTAAAEWVLEVERRASLRSTSVATVGRLQVEPGALTTIPGEVVLTLDVRDLDSDAQREIVEALLDHAVAIAQKRGLGVEAELLSDQSPVLLHDTVQERLVAAATDASIPFLVMPSGASHDAAHIAKLVPTGMLFVPSRAGLSHAPDEWTAAADISRGAGVLAQAMADLAARDAI